MADLCASLPDMVRSPWVTEVCLAAFPLINLPISSCVCYTPVLHHLTRALKSKGAGRKRRVSEDGHAACAHFEAGS
jgi:hypothetical protein